MTGDRLARVLKRLLHEDTFQLFLAPAIADLQHAPSADAYLAVWRSFAGALIQDASGDANAMVNDIGLMLGLVAIQTCYYGGMLLLLVADVRGDEMLNASRVAGPLVATVIGLLLASAVPTLFCFWPPRRTLDV